MSRRWLIPLVPLVFAAVIATPAPAATTRDRVGFPNGVAVGEVTATTAVFWARTDRPAAVKLEVSRHPSFRGRDVFHGTVHTAAADDFTAHVEATGLSPATTYFYRWRHGAETAPTGTFRTAPGVDAAADVRFAYTGDSDGTLVNGQPAFNNFEVLDAIRAERPDFWVYLGDTIYADSGHRTTGPAVTVDEYRDAYEVNRGYRALPGLLASTSTYAMWDDHEVHNDFDGQTVDPARYAAGRQAFLEWMPLTGGKLVDSSCAGDPLFRTFSWGSEVDVIVLDERSCRSADVEAICGDDLVPTLPAALRTMFGLPASPPAGCLDAIFDPRRTMLGPVQLAAFEQALLTSNASFKLVVNEVPIQQYWALPYDRWEGYGAERNDVINFIRDHGITGVGFLTTDNHANFFNDVFIDRFTDAEPVADETVAGPIATNTLEQEIINLVGPAGVAAFQAVLGVAGVGCRQLDTYAYALVEVDADAGTATVSLRDQTGAVLADVGDPTVPCIHAIE
jgi:alkaline phosphatase D